MKTGGNVMLKLRMLGIVLAAGAYCNVSHAAPNLEGIDMIDAFHHLRGAEFTLKKETTFSRWFPSENRASVKLLSRADGDGASCSFNVKIESRHLRVAPGTKIKLTKTSRVYGQYNYLTKTKPAHQLWMEGYLEKDGKTLPVSMNCSWPSDAFWPSTTRGGSLSALDAAIKKIATGDFIAPSLDSEAFGSVAEAPASEAQAAEGVTERSK